MLVCYNHDWRHWAKAWLSGQDQTLEAAAAAAAAPDAARSVRMWAASSSAWAASDADAAMAAERAARAAGWAAENVDIQSVLHDVFGKNIETKTPESEDA